MLCAITQSMAVFSLQDFYIYLCTHPPGIAFDSKNATSARTGSPRRIKERTSVGFRLPRHMCHKAG